MAKTTQKIERGVNLPEIGSKLYVQGSMSISNGSTDVQGGLATIESFEFSDHLPTDHFNYVMVKFKEIHHTQYNLRMLLEKQEKLKEKYQDQIAKPDPDEDRPWIESGDMVNGKRYVGKDIW